MECNLEPLKAMHLQSVHIGYNKVCRCISINERNTVEYYSYNFYGYWWQYTLEVVLNIISAAPNSSKVEIPTLEELTGRPAKEKPRTVDGILAPLKKISNLKNKGTIQSEVKLSGSGSVW